MAPSSALQVTEIDTPELRNNLAANNKEPTVVSRAVRLKGKARTDDKNGPRPKFKTQSKAEDKIMKKIVRQDTLSMESKKSQ